MKGPDVESRKERPPYTFSCCPGTEMRVAPKDDRNPALVSGLGQIAYALKRTMSSSG